MVKFTHPSEYCGSDSRFFDVLSQALHSRLEIGSYHVDIWFANFALSAQSLDLFTALLDEVELSRMASFKFKYLRYQFVCAHGLLRILLSIYAKREPKDLAFKLGAYGKPELVDAEGLSFSLSHTGQSVALAVARHVDIGLDIEQIKPIADRRSLIERFFSTKELVLYDETAHAEQESVFFKLWTRKEAFIKGLGLGLSYPLDVFSVGISEPVSLTGKGTEEWSLHHLEPGLGLTGALAVRSHIFTQSSVS